MDQLRDQNLTKLHQINISTHIPEFVKEADAQTLEDVKELPSTAFANPFRREYPINTKADTWLSTAYFYKFAGENPIVEENLEKAQEFWGLTSEEIDSAKAFTITKEAAEGTEDVVLFKYAGEVMEQSSINTSEDFEKLAADLSKNAAKYPYEMRRDAARQLLEINGEDKYCTNVQSLDTLQKIAGYGANTKENTLEVIKSRALYHKRTNPEVYESLEKAAAFVQEAPCEMLNKNTLDKIASFVDMVDRLTDSHRFYGTSLNAPEKDLFKYTANDNKLLQKQAVMLPNGRVVSRSKLHEKQAEISSFLSDVCHTKTASVEEIENAIGTLSTKRAESLFNIIES